MMEEHSRRFEEMIAKSLGHLQNMSETERGRLKSFWKSTSLQFDTLFSQHSISDMEQSEAADNEDSNQVDKLVIANTSEQVEMAEDTSLDTQDVYDIAPDKEDAPIQAQEVSLVHCSNTTLGIATDTDLVIGAACTNIILEECNDQNDRVSTEQVQGLISNKGDDIVIDVQEPSSTLHTERFSCIKDSEACADIEGSSVLSATTGIMTATTPEHVPQDNPTAENILFVAQSGLETTVPSNGQDDAQVVNKANSASNAGYPLTAKPNILFVTQSSFPTAQSSNGKSGAQKVDGADSGITKGNPFPNTIVQIHENTISQSSSPSLIQVGNLIIDLNTATPVANSSTLPKTNEVKSQKRTPNAKTQKEEPFNTKPRRSNRKVKTPSLYNDYIITSGVYSKSEVDDIDYFVDAQSQNFQSTGTSHRVQRHNHSNAKAISPMATPSNSNTISIRTVNPFPCNASVDQPVQLDPGGTVFQLRLSSNPSDAITEVRDDDTTTTYPVHHQPHTPSSQTAEPDIPFTTTEDEYNSQNELVNESQVIEIIKETFEQEQEGDRKGSAVQRDEAGEGPVQKGTEHPHSTHATAQKSGKKCKKKVLLSIGIKKNANDMYECPECHKQMASYSNVRVHMRSHTGEKPYGCRQCGRLFSTITNMLRHERTIHNKEKLFECDQCLKCFTEKKSLIIHQRIHTGERPYKCTICSQAFAQSGTLKTHLHRHLGIKGHLCDFCGKSFRQKSQLLMHSRRHTNTRNFKCTECSKAFVSKSELVRHQMGHTGDRPYLCSLCPKTFTRLQYLREHHNLHTNTTPYQCKICSQAFHDLASHAKHVKRHALTATTTEPIEMAKENENLKETFVFLPDPETGLYVQDVQEIKHTEKEQAAEAQVPTMVSEECVEEVPIEESEVELDMDNPTNPMTNSNMIGIVEVSTSDGATYIADLPTEMGEHNKYNNDTVKHVAIELHSIPTGSVQTAELQSGRKYIVIEPLNEEHEQLNRKRVEAASDCDDNVRVVEVRSQYNESTNNDC